MKEKLAKVIGLNPNTKVAAMRKKGKPKVDYTRLDPKQAALTAVWALGITPLAINAIYSTVDQFIHAPGPTAVKYLGM